MILNIQTSKDKWLEKVYQQSMVELDEFFKLNWQQNQPKVFIVKNRQEIDKIKTLKTPEFVRIIARQNPGVAMAKQRCYS